MPWIDRLPLEASGVRLRSPFQSTLPPWGPAPLRVICAPLSGRVLRLCSSKPSGSKTKSTCSLGRLSWKCTLPWLRATRSMRSGKGLLSGCSGLGSLGGSLNRRPRLRLPSSANTTSPWGLSSCTSARCSWRVHRLSSCRLAYRRSKATCSWPGWPMRRPQTFSSRLKGLSSMRSMCAGTVAYWASCWLATRRAMPGRIRKPSRQ